ncbi:MAG: hypothetical protein ACXWFC_10065, partial [Nitrososphaeraceae archaeon]
PGANIGQEAQTDTAQEATGANIGQEAQTDTAQEATGANIGQEAQTETDQTATGANVDQQSQQQSNQQSFGGDIDQKITQTASQVAKASEDPESEDAGDVQQVIKQIANQASSGRGNVDKIVNQISTQIAKDPSGDLAKSLGNLAGFYGSGNKDQVNQAIKQIGTQVAVGNNINQVLVQVSNQVTNNYFKNKIKIDIDNDRDNDNVKIIKKVYKRDNSCPTQSDSIQLKGKILPKGVIVLADFEPCELKDGRATLNIPGNPNLKFVVLFIDKKGNDHEGAIITKQKVQSLSKDSGLYVVNFDNKMTGIDPVTGKKITLDKINGLALYNVAKKALDFKSGNSLALTAVLQK